MNCKAAANAVLNSVKIVGVFKREVGKLIKSFVKNLRSEGGIRINQGCGATNLVTGAAEVVDFTKISSNKILVVVEIYRGVGSQDLGNGIAREIKT